MRKAHAIMAVCGSFLLVGCLGVEEMATAVSSPVPARPTATTDAPATPSPTSLVADAVNETLIHAGSFKLTVTMVTHLSNAIQLTLSVRNASDQAADWDPSGEIEQAYLQDGDDELSPLQAHGIFGRAATLQPGEEQVGFLIFPLPTHDTFRFVYPDSAPESVDLSMPR